MNPFLKSLLVGAAVLIVLAFLISSGTARGVSPPQSTSPTKKVAELFKQNCAVCHGANGRGDTPQGKFLKTPDFTDPIWRKKNSSITGTKSLRAAVTRGKDKMPAFGTILTQSEINSLVDRVRKFRK
jgi:mono/diheme cytochrome c family protein